MTTEYSATSTVDRPAVSALIGASVFGSVASWILVQDDPTVYYSLLALSDRLDFSYSVLAAIRLSLAAVAIAASCFLVRNVRRSRCFHYGAATFVGSLLMGALVVFQKDEPPTFALIVPPAGSFAYAAVVALVALVQSILLGARAVQAVPPHPLSAVGRDEAKPP